MVIYEALVEGKLEAPKHLARTVHDLYFEPKYEEFKSRTIWSLSNAFTGEHFHVASVRRGAVEHLRSDRAASVNLSQRCILEIR